MMPLGVKSTMPIPGEGGYGGPPVRGPGQGILPLGPKNPIFGNFGTGTRGSAPPPAAGVGPFDQTATDIANLWDFGTTAPYYTKKDWAKHHNLGLGALFKPEQATMAVGMAELDRMYRNVSQGLDHYAGQLMPWSMLGNIPGGPGTAQYSVPPGQVEPRRIEFDDVLPVAPRGLPPGTANPDNLIRPKVPGYPATDPTAGGLGGPFVPGPGNPQYPPSQAQQDKIFNKSREMKKRIKDWLRRRQERRQMKVNPAKFET